MYTKVRKLYNDVPPHVPSINNYQLIANLHDLFYHLLLPLIFIALFVIKQHIY